MSKKNFIVIEGDNGTGKDTLAQGLAPYGFNILTYHPDAKAALTQAREEAGKGGHIAPVTSFLNYNLECSRLVKKYDSQFDTNILIRYWPSSLAAAFADRNWSVSEVDKKLDELIPLMATPLCVIRLTCDMEERVKRIIERNAEGFDDITLERAQKYNYIFSHIMDRTPYEWVTISTSGISRKQIVDKTLDAVARHLDDDPSINHKFSA